VPTDDRGEPGRVLAAGERLVVGCGDGALAVREVQPAGRTRLPVKEWVRGRGISLGARLG
jgi:methionyl-tRNA formyltransferase